MDYMISMFIDDELGIDEKLEFVGQVHEDGAFKNELIALLHQEKLLRSEVVSCIPPVEIKARRRALYSILRPLRILGPAMGAALVIFFLFMSSKGNPSIPHRFVIFRPDVEQVAITGDFTEWKMVSMKRTGDGEYWEITLNLPKGEHRFTYIVDGEQRFADPTVPTREQDDFGGENSILLVQA